MDKELIGFLAFIFLIVVFIGLPITYLEGSAKSEYLKQAKNINLPWYQAAYLQIDINQTDANVKLETKSK
jgi:hypothetical protein